MNFKTLVRKGFSKSEARKLATPRKSSKDNCNNFDATKILKKVGLSKADIKEALNEWNVRNQK